MHTFVLWSSKISCIDYTAQMGVSMGKLVSEKRDGQIGSQLVDDV
ncbi:hypothetical protein [Anaplasma phagocytophilum]|nr:hypothetical protein [Anaplasma phagocytophilum]